MKHTIKGLHGHLYELDGGAAKKGRLSLGRICVSRRQIAETDLVSEKLELSWRVSRKWRTCWQCHAETDQVGGYAAHGHSKPLFYECEKCSE